MRFPQLGLYVSKAGTGARFPRFSRETHCLVRKSEFANDTHISMCLAIGAVAALLVGAVPAHAQLMNESSQVTPTPGNPTLGEPGLGMSDVVKQSGPPQTLFGYFRRDKLGPETQSHSRRLK